MAFLAREKYNSRHGGESSSLSDPVVSDGESRQADDRGRLDVSDSEQVDQAVVKDDVESTADKTPPSLDLRSLREIFERDGDVDEIRKLVHVYLPELKKAFPLPGEIESEDDYVDYLTDPNSNWNMVQMLGPVQGGIQYQVLSVDGEKIAKVGWLEHIWVAEPIRAGGYGTALLKEVQGRMQEQGANTFFWEWNNPEKMDLDQLAEDERGGITTQDRVDYWARRGARVAVTSTGEIAPYAQPGMDGEDPVDYLSLAWVGTDEKTISKSDYLKTLRTAHSTIPDVDLDTDPTVLAYTAELDALPDKEFKLVPLKDYIAERTSAMSEAAEARRKRLTGEDFTEEMEDLA